VSEEWKAIPALAVASSAVCADTNPNVSMACAARSTPGGVLLASGLISAFRADTIWTQARLSPPIPGGAGTGLPALTVHPSNRISVMVRGGDGRLKRITYKTDGSWGAWEDIGGSLAPGSSPSCQPDGEVSVCVVRGPDGAGWLKRLPPATAL
jgi:hypothetical protein